jgi:hypothetical protein
MSELREYGMTFEEWGRTFALNPEARHRMGKYAEALLEDSQFNGLLAEMEHNALAAIRRFGDKDEDRVLSAHRQIQALHRVMHMLRSFSADNRLKEGKN